MLPDIQEIALHLGSLGQLRKNDTGLNAEFVDGRVHCKLAPWSFSAHLIHV